MLKIRFSDCFIAATEFQVFSAKSFSRTYVLFKKVVLKENLKKRPMQESFFKKAGLLSSNLFCLNFFLYKRVPVNFSKYLRIHFFAEQCSFLRQVDLSPKVLHSTFFIANIFIYFKYLF